MGLGRGRADIKLAKHRGRETQRGTMRKGFHGPLDHDKYFFYVYMVASLATLFRGLEFDTTKNA